MSWSSNVGDELIWRERDEKAGEVGGMGGGGRGGIRNGEGG